MKQTIKTIIFLALMILTAGQAIGQDLGYIICNPSDLDGGSLSFYKGMNSEQVLVNQISIDATTHKSGNLSSSDLESNRVYILATADETHQNYHVTITVEKKVDSGDSYPPDVPLWDDEINAPQFRAPSNNELTVTPVSYGIYYFEMPDDGSNVQVSATWTQPYTIQDSNNATITNVEVGTETTTVTIPATVSDGTNDVPVTSIADGTFTQENTANVQSIDLSNTQVTFDTTNGTDRDKIDALKNIPENTLIYLPATASAVTGDNVIIKEANLDNFTCANFVMDGSNATGKSYSVPKAFNAVQTTLNREFEEGVAATVCLPFALSQEVANTLGSFYYFSSVTGSTVNMTQVTTGGLESNKPYMFLPNSTTATNNKVSAANVSVGISGSQVSAETGGGTFTFQGVIADKTFTQTEIDGGIYGFAATADHGATSVGQFVRGSMGASIKAFRAYLICSTDLTGESHTNAPQLSDGSNALPETMDVVLVHADGSTTAIGKITLMKDDDAPQYNLSGQRVSKGYKGLVIMNGKKAYNK